MALVVLAAWMALVVLCTPASGAEMDPKRDSGFVSGPANWQIAVEAYRSEDWVGAAIAFDDALCQAEERAAPWAEVDALEMWSALSYQAGEQFPAAILQWEPIVMSAETAPWRNVALAAAYVECGHLTAAETELDKAGVDHEASALVHYYRGLVLLEQAQRAAHWYETLAPQRVKWAVYRKVPAVEVPMTSDIYELMAVGQLEQAARLAEAVDPGQLLLPAAAVIDPALSPTVGDLLAALGARQFQAQAHQMLGHLLLQRDQTAMAESHLDRASALHTIRVWGYEDLGDQYAQQGRHLDAARAYCKEVRNGPKSSTTSEDQTGNGAAAAKLLRQLGRAIGDTWLR
jgi:tetratricopeptide (TPR) repeat protein